MLSFSTWHFAVPVDCQIVYREWSECDGQKRTQQSYISVQPVGTGRPCPSPLPIKEEGIRWKE